MDCDASSLQSVNNAVMLLLPLPLLLKSHVVAGHCPYSHLRKTVMQNNSTTSREASESKMSLPVLELA